MTIAPGEDEDLLRQAAIAERDAALDVARDGALAATHVMSPRHRIFLPQTPRDRIRGFWWSLVRNSLFRFSPLSATAWRNVLLRLFGARIERGVAIAPSAVIEYPWNLTLHRGAVICDHVIINCMGSVEIGEHSRISQYAHLCAGTHEYQRPDMRIEPRPIALGDRVWIAADAFVGPGVTIHAGAMLAARSSAFHDLPAGMICVGEPARPVKPRG